MNKIKSIILFHIFLTGHLFGQADSGSTFNSHLNLFSRFSSGEYFNWNEPEYENRYGISYTGFQLFNDIKLEGGLSYQSIEQKNTFWPFYTPDIYPYLLFEKSKKTFYSNNISLYGGYYHDLTKKINLGALVSYANSITYNRIDPRFKITGYKLGLKPVLKVNYYQLKLCLIPLIINSGNEFDMQIKGLHPVEIYQLLGLGLSENVFDYEFYTGKITQRKLGIDGDVAYASKRLQALLKIQAHQDNSKVTQSNISWSVLIPEALIKSSVFSLEPNISLMGKRFTHKLSYSFTQQNKTGKEFIKRKFNDSLIVSEYWKIYGTVDKYLQYDLFQKFAYVLDFKLRHYNLSLNSGIESTEHKENYEGIIQRYKYSYKWISPFVLLSFERKSPNYIFSLEAGFSKRLFNLSENDILDGIPSDYVYYKEIQYFNRNAGILSFNGTFGKYHKLFGSESLSHIGLNSTFIIPENGQSMRSVVEISLQVDF
ncbi:DUF6850 family outer membrane beta-barrel protein [Saccharicrinis sp. FJH54]|uniref:DUF6850 family outer membrane beta-barrel protein n=1 Tax=Saccharicrinis sp. FJH54 TaxID=3344665 RepID=UPI0035D49F28